MRRRSARTPLPRPAFARFRFPTEVITVAARWYLRYGLSYRDVEELLAERDTLDGFRRGVRQRGRRLDVSPGWKAGGFDGAAPLSTWSQGPSGRDHLRVGRVLAAIRVDMPGWPLFCVLEPQLGDCGGAGILTAPMLRVIELR